MAPRHPREEEESESDQEPEEHAARQTFQDQDGVAIIFFIHKSVKKGHQRRNLTHDIENNGGVVSDTHHMADTVIIDHEAVDRSQLQLRYHCDRGRSGLPPIFVEPMSFVRRCMREGMVRHRLPSRQGMGGMVGRRRTAFTDEDEDNFCWYISRLIPVEKDGGRLGRRVYTALEELGISYPRTYAWARRHTWQSWKERYKKNAARLNIIINNYAERDPPPEYGRYHRRRGWSNKYQDYDTESDYIESTDVDESDAEHPEFQPHSLHGKRRRSGVTSHPSAAPAKRQRADAYARGRDTRDMQARSNGKRKVVIPDDEESSDRSTLFSADEADFPDVRPESPNTHEYVEQEARLDFGSPPPLGMPQTSQMTLINPPSQKYSDLVDELPIPPPSMAMPNPLPVNVTAEVEHEAHIASSSLASHSRVHSPQQPNEANVTPSQTGKRTEPSPVVPSVPAPRPRAVKKRAGRPKPPVSNVAPFEAPYRNTRLRSRSVEPPAPLPLSAASKESNRKEKKISQLQPLQESGREDDSTPLDVDDEQTRRDLRQAQEQSRPPTLRNKHILKNFNDTLPSALQPRQSSIRPSLPAHSRLDTSAASSSYWGRNVEPKTPVRSLQTRKNSTSSTDSFPVAGTRASDVKKKYEQVEKRSPYKPPAGTRAAQHTLSR